MVSVILLTVFLCIRQVNVKKVIMITLSVLLALESLLGMSTLSSIPLSCLAPFHPSRLRPAILLPSQEARSNIPNYYAVVKTERYSNYGIHHQAKKHSIRTSRT